MSNQNRAFKPLSATQNISVGIAASSITLNSPFNNSSVRLVNSGTQVVFIKFDGTATLTDSIPILANTDVTLTMPTGAVALSAIAGATGSTLYATVGEGKE